jgi:hypothetical protein
LEGATSLVFLLGKVKRGEEVEIQNKIDLHLFNVFIVFPFYLLLSRNSNEGVVSWDGFLLFCISYDEILLFFFLPNNYSLDLGCNFHGFPSMQY